MKRLAVIIPSVRGMGAVPTIKSALKLKGFDTLDIIIGGKSCKDETFIRHCRRLSPHIVFADPVDSDHVLPGMARNQCLEILDKKFEDTTHVLFLDDDIVVPEDFAQTLTAFLEKEPGVAAVMGRAATCPRSYWTRVLDYSHFWWLQVEYDILDLGWMGGGETMTTYEKIKGFRFNEGFSSTEDMDYFRKVSRARGGTFAICGQTTCSHFHDRRKLDDVLKYQYHNGKQAQLLYHSPKVGIRSVLIGIRNILAYLKRSFLANHRYLIKRPHMVPGMIICIVAFELGIQAGIFKRSHLIK
jgi:GT2 family glycosyltransferase